MGGLFYYSVRCNFVAALLLEGLEDLEFLDYLDGLDYLDCLAPLAFPS